MTENTIRPSPGLPNKFDGYLSSQRLSGTMLRTSAPTLSIVERELIRDSLASTK